MPGVSPPEGGGGKGGVGGGEGGGVGGGGGGGGSREGGWELGGLESRFFRMGKGKKIAVLCVRRALVSRETVHRDNGIEWGSKKIQRKKNGLTSTGRISSRGEKIMDGIPLKSCGKRGWSLMGSGSPYLYNERREFHENSNASWKGEKTLSSKERRKCPNTKESWRERGGPCSAHRMGGKAAARTKGKSPNKKRTDEGRGGGSAPGFKHRGKKQTVCS